MPWEHGGIMSEQAVIVIVEDDGNIADLVDLYLRRADHRVHQASTGEKALEAEPRRWWSRCPQSGRRRAVVEPSGQTTAASTGTSVPRRR